MTYRDFGAARRESIEDPIEFGLGGERFEVPQPVPILPLLDLAAIDPDTDERAAMVAFRDCILGLIDPGDHPRFRKACRAARADHDLLGDIVKWILPLATGRPTQRRSSSDDSPSSTGAESNDGSTEPAAAATS